MTNQQNKLSWRTFKANKTQYNNKNHYNNKPNYNNKTQYNNKKYNNKKKDNIFLLTRDNYYFILEKKFVKKSHLFQNIFDGDSSAGHLRNPIYLQKTISTHFKYVLQYLKHYEGIKEQKWEYNDIISIHDLYNIYDNEWDIIFIQDIERTYKNNMKDFEELLKTIQYMGIDNLYNKVKYCHDFLVNTKIYNLDDINNELDYISDKIEQEYDSSDSEAEEQY